MLFITINRSLTSQECNLEDYVRPDTEVNQQHLYLQDGIKKLIFLSSIVTLQYYDCMGLHHQYERLSFPFY